ncbi:MAG: hypothetical protein ABI644_02470 [Arenimonas sp.]
MSLLDKSDSQILELVTPLMDNMMLASTEIDHEKHVRDFTERMRGIVSKEWLEYVCKDYQAKWGLFGKREFVALFRRKESVAVVWRQFCSNSSDEYVAETVFVEHNDRILIDHAMVF